MKSLLSIAFVVVMATSGGAMAQATAPAMATPAAKPSAVQMAKPVAAPKATASIQAPRTAKSLDCSKQADAKGLHGKPRKAFMSACKKA